MKKAFLLALVMVFALAANAQKGSMYLGTSGISAFGDDFTFAPMTGFNSYTDKSGADDVTTTSFGLAPEVGYFVTDQLAVGLGIYYTYSKTDVDGADATNVFGFNPYARYYFLGEGNFKMYGQFGISYASSTTGDADAISYLGIGIKPGISYNLSDRFAINATFGNLGYESVKDDYSNFGLNLDMSSLRFGFTVSF